MNIYKRELRAHWKSLLIWSAVMVFLVLAGIGKYTAGAGAGTDVFNNMMSKMPKSLQALFGVGVFDFSKIVDYYGVLFLYIALVASVHAVMLGNSIIAKEERDKTAEFLLAKPVSRKTILTEKLAAALTEIIIINAVTSLVSYAVLLKYTDGEPFHAALLKLMASLFALQVIFMTLGALLAAGCGKYKKSSAAATAILLGMFLLYIAVDISGKIDFLGYATFFKYYDAKTVLKGDYNFLYVIITVILTALFTYGAYFMYHKRDMKV